MNAIDGIDSAELRKRRRHRALLLALLLLDETIRDESLLPNFFKEILPPSLKPSEVHLANKSLHLIGSICLLVMSRPAYNRQLKMAH